jgi:hypothetical protein
LKAFAGSRCIDTVMPTNSPNEALPKSPRRDRGIRVPENAAGGIAEVMPAYPKGHHARTLSARGAAMDPLRDASTTSSFFGVGIGDYVILSIGAFPLSVPCGRPFA